MKAATKDATKNRPKRFKGIVAAADALDVTRVHLWQVLTGRRESKPLMARYAALTPEAIAAHAKNKIPPQKRIVPLELAAAENLSPFFFNTLATLGLEVVIVRFDAKLASPIWGHSGIERDIERELQSIQAGQFDSSWFTSGAQWHFFHVAAADLGKAMQQIKSFLAAC